MTLPDWREVIALFALTDAERSVFEEPKQANRILRARIAASMLKQDLRPEAIPQVVRRPAPALGGKTLLELIEFGEAEKLIEFLRRLGTAQSWQEAEGPPT